MVVGGSETNEKAVQDRKDEQVPICSAGIGIREACIAAAQ